MELIDRVAFMNDLAKRTEANKDLFKDDIQYLQVALAINAFFQDLKEFPIVEVESRPKGKWIDEMGQAYCSECGTRSPDQSNGVEIEPMKPKWCYGCGAEMER